ncbi:DUF4149 domain-containing protein [Sulfobacillus harzensis]|uniref:TMEM205-like domain-containing protein n=1 Tax=Sulfobacillus harzensis TaxID=2729629 RepID=A0A7Y0L131_9FIRM|nr:DUF4149 domain-containing protein [Sulfobacillus harzensis]NMP21366.1 hypothetical protein [Sulfobacillus harzensis]
MRDVNAASTNAPTLEPLIPVKRLTWWVLALPALLVVSLAIHSFYLLLLSHVMAGCLWTGADIFMGFILGPVWKHLDPQQRQAVQRRLVPNTFLYMPVLAITTGTAGWYVAQYDGFIESATPIFPWVVAAGVVVVILTVVGLGILLPTNLKVLNEVRKPNPDPELLKQWTFRTRRLATIQGLFQVIIMIIMAYLAIAP